MSLKRLLICGIILSQLLGQGCALTRPNEIDFVQVEKNSEDYGVITGSVTAPAVANYHLEVYFIIRSEQSALNIESQISSGTRFPVVVWSLPPCDQHDLTEQCGRLFAKAFPAGDYQIEQMLIAGQSFDLHPAIAFKVKKGFNQYLGNLHVEFCQGMIRSLRGGILGANITFNDHYLRDQALLQKHFLELNGSKIENVFSGSSSWQWRVDYKPADWGNCESP